MNRDLTQSERKLLQGISAKLSYQSRVLRKLKATDQRVLAWCEEQDLLHINTQAIKSTVDYGYTRELLNAIDARLAQLGLAPLEADLKASSLEQAGQGAAEHKSVRISPREYRVLRVLGAQIIDQDLRELTLAQYCELVVVENLDCFYELARFKLPLSPTSLVIYRGDSHYSQGRSKLLTHWQKGEYGPLKYFGDLDPQGLHIAISEGFSHLAMPEFAWFNQHASEQAYSTKQHAIAQHLQHSGELHPYIAFMQRRQRALLQQWLQDIPLQWLAITSY